MSVIINFSASGGGGGTPGGLDTYVQYNKLGAFAGDPNFSYDYTDVAVFVGTPQNTDTGYNSLGVATLVTDGISAFNGAAPDGAGDDLFITAGTAAGTGNAGSIFLRVPAGAQTQDPIGTNQNGVVMLDGANQGGLFEFVMPYNPVGVGQTFVINAGNGTTGGGGISLEAGAPVNSGAAGFITIAGSFGVGSGGGNLTFFAGGDFSGGNGGNFSATAGDGNSGGGFTFTSGGGLGSGGGLLSFNSGSDTNGASGGNIAFRGGNGSGGGGANLFFTGGNDSAAGAGGNVQFTGGNSVNQVGGGVTITTGESGGAFNGGDITFNFGTGGSRNGLFFPNLPTSDPGVSGAMFSNLGIVQISP